MCWSETASYVLVGVGVAATITVARRGEPKAIWLTVGYFTFMEALQATAYSVIDECASPVNQTLAFLLYAHIAFQPLFINAFAMAIAPSSVPSTKRRWVYLLASFATFTLLLRLVPFGTTGTCEPDFGLCGPEFCVQSGTWHLAWELPLNVFWGGYGSYLQEIIPYPDYYLAVFLLPLLYGAWRFVLFHAFFGPILARSLTSDPNEMPAIWCLFSIGIILISLSPLIRKKALGSAR